MRNPQGSCSLSDCMWRAGLPFIAPTPLSVKVGKRAFPSGPVNVLRWGTALAACGIDLLRQNYFGSFQRCPSVPRLVEVEVRYSRLPCCLELALPRPVQAAAVRVRSLVAREARPKAVRADGPRVVEAIHPPLVRATAVLPARAAAPGRLAVARYLARAEARRSCARIPNRPVQALTAPPGRPGVNAARSGSETAGFATLPAAFVLRELAVQEPAATEPAPRGLAAREPARGAVGAAPTGVPGARRRRCPKPPRHSSPQPTPSPRPKPRGRAEHFASMARDT